ncbi:MAG: hypothetical protein V4473_00315 [Patescibacteria group bacterium]
MPDKNKETLTFLEGGGTTIINMLDGKRVGYISMGLFFSQKLVLPVEILEQVTRKMRRL